MARCPAPPAAPLAAARWLVGKTLDANHR